MRYKCFFFSVAGILLVLLGLSDQALADGAKIELENTSHDFGKVEPASRHKYEFSFTNTGSDVLVIEDVTGTCGCTPFELEKTEYEPGQSGVLKVRYNASRRETHERHRIFVTTNDPSNRRVVLTVTGTVVSKVSFAPARLNLALNKENGGAGTIILTSNDGQAFAIRSFRSTGNIVSADFDRDKKAEKFELKPIIDMDKLNSGSTGSIRIGIDHPEAREIAIPFTTLDQYEITPQVINILNAEPAKVIEREIWIFNNHDEEFEIESVSSENNLAELISKKQFDSRYQLLVKIVPPQQSAGISFNDTLSIQIAESEKLELRIRGFFRRN